LITAVRQVVDAAREVKTAMPLNLREVTFGQ
jgi:hypothetical protein